AGGVVFSSGAISAGIIIWATRAGYFVALVSGSLPAWAVVDPIPVLDADAIRNQTNKRAPARSQQSLADIAEASTEVAVVFGLDGDLQMDGTVLESTARLASASGIELISPAPITTPYLRIQLATVDKQEIDVVVRVESTSLDGDRYHVHTHVVENAQPHSTIPAVAGTIGE
ncbi:MAG: hypothetical protein KDA60_17975, partial [Planctomycetales bacterium]|nr:hypothetical protein [Planctomycetales bacterium]